MKNLKNWIAGSLLITVGLFVPVALGWIIAIFILLGYFLISLWDYLNSL